MVSPDLMFFSQMAATDAAKECLIRQILSNAHDGMLMSVIGSEYSKRNELIPFGKGLGSFMKARGTIFSCDEERWSLRRQISESKSFEVKRIASSSSCSSVVRGKKKRLAEMRNNLMTIFHQFPSTPVEFLSEYLRLHESISANHPGEFFKCTVHQRLRVSSRNIPITSSIRVRTIKGSVYHCHYCRYHQQSNP
jgi:hypothetical protein